MPPGGRMGGPMGGQYLTEEEKKNQPKVTPLSAHLHNSIVVFLAPAVDPDGQDIR